MTYDSKTQTITVGPNSDFFSDSGAFFINVLRDQAQMPNANQSLKNDWSVIEEWLGCAGRALNQQDFEKIGKAWRAYYAIGVAPSHSLQKQFDDLSAKYKASGKSFDADKAPTKVMDVFDRLLATDAEIKAKQAADWAAEKAKFSEIFNKLTVKQKTSWWRRQSRVFRAWIFISAAWAAAALFYISVFDPFELGDWDYADDKDYLKAFSIIAAPLIIGLVKRAYDRAVKWVAPNLTIHSSRSRFAARLNSGVGPPKTMRIRIPFATVWFLACVAPQSLAAQAIPTEARAVIQQVHKAAKAKNFSALEKLMVSEFLWSFGGDGDAKQAIEAWKANPRALKELYRVTGSPCSVRTDSRVECPRNAGVSYRAHFKKTAEGWRMVSFVEGD